MRPRPATVRRRIYALACVTLMLALTAGAARADGPKFPPLTGRVVDDAGVLSDDTRATLTEMLAAHERETGNQVVVVTVKDLQGYTIEEYGYQLGRKWASGQKGKNNGVLLIVAPTEHKVRIEVGYGLEGTLTDASSRAIIERDILPDFRLGLYDSGILAGTTSILRVLGGNPLELGTTARSTGEVGATAPSTSEGEREASAVLQHIPAPILVALALMGPFLPFALICGVMILISRHSNFNQGGYDRDSWSSGGSGGGSSGGGGGFSGGGGSFGGGGATGSW